MAAQRNFNSVVIVVLMMIVLNLSRTNAEVCNPDDSVVRCYYKRAKDALGLGGCCKNAFRISLEQTNVEDSEPCSFFMDGKGTIEICYDGTMADYGSFCGKRPCHNLYGCICKGDCRDNQFGNDKTEALRLFKEFYLVPGLEAKLIDTETKMADTEAKTVDAETEVVDPEVEIIADTEATIVDTEVNIIVDMEPKVDEQ